MKNRYVVTKPVPHGYAWWRVADTMDPALPNAEVVIVRRDVPGAGKLAREVCRMLNRKERGR